MITWKRLGEHVKGKEGSPIMFVPPNQGTSNFNLGSQQLIGVPDFFGKPELPDFYCLYL